MQGQAGEQSLVPRADPYNGVTILGHGSEGWFPSSTCVPRKQNLPMNRETVSSPC